MVTNITHPNVSKSTRTRTVPNTIDADVINLKTKKTLSPLKKEPIEETLTTPFAVFHRTSEKLYVVVNKEKHYVCTFIQLDGHIHDPVTDMHFTGVKVKDHLGNDHYIIVNKAKMFYPQQLFNQLVERGWQVLDRALAMKLLGEIIKCDQPQKNIILVKRPGWHQIFGSNIKVYVLDKKVFKPSGTKFEIILGDDCSATYQSNGSLEDWKNYVGQFCSGNSRLIFAISAGLAGPVLDLIGYQSTGLHLFGFSRSGKTTTIKVLCSLFGNRDFGSSWYATSNALQATAIKYSDSSLTLDEIAQCDAKSVSAAVYHLTNSATKGRANAEGKANTANKFRLIVFSSGEMSLASYLLQDGIKIKPGQISRFLSIPSPKKGMFTNFHGKESLQKFAEMLIDNTSKYFGTAGPEFIQHLVDDQINIIQSLQLQIDDIQVQLLSNINDEDISDLYRDAAGRFSVIAATGELAISYGIFPFKAGEVIKACDLCFRAWCTNDKIDASQRDPIFSSLKEYFLKNQASFYPLTQYTSCPSFEEVFTHTANGIEAFLVEPNYFERTLCQQFGKAAGIKALKDRSLLILGATRAGPTRQVRVPKEIPELKVSFYVISTRILTTT